MNPELLEKVLACRKLPSLPAVAMRVVELTQSTTINMRELAQTIQNDQALAAKILRTVNSSLFGLRQKCSSINQAIIMLGMSAVKTLALGFSLVSAIKDASDEGLDMSDHWRRSLYTGIAAKAIAGRAGIGYQEECFLGGLLQDVGQVALYQTLGKQYTELLECAGGDHRKVTKLELERLQLQHPDLGAMLAQRWKLPDELVMPIKFHERPTAAPSQYVGICRAVGLGNIASDFLTSSEPTVHLRRFYDRAEQWFRFDNAAADEILKVIADNSRDVSSLLQVQTGLAPNAEQMLDLARAQLAAVQLPSIDEADPTQAPGSVGVGVNIDELTGVADRTRFDQNLIAAFEQASAEETTLSMVLVDIDGLEKINQEYGEDAGDTVLVTVAGRLERAARQQSVLLSRYDSGSFALLLPKTDRVTAVKFAESARTSIVDEPVALIAARPGAPATLKVTASVGVASLSTAALADFADAAAVSRITEQAVRAAKQGGRNTIRVYAPMAKAAA